MLIAGSEGGDERSGSNVRAITAKYGIRVEDDVVIRCAFHKYTHPKEVFISKGVANKQFGIALARCAVKGGLTAKYVRPRTPALHCRPMLHTRHSARCHALSLPQHAQD